MIVEIEVKKLKNHPKNVRKSYNGIDELADSIKAQGILQNLTVVPDPDDQGMYLVVIGNRRLMAAKKAGLKTVPCNISEMDEKEQTAAMLLENMQRNDLTVYEESSGFQMCLDLGMSENELSEKTGLSKQTIRHRTKIQLLDQELVEKKSSEGATIFDFIKLEQIKDIGHRNKVLESIGSQNFNYELERAIRSEKEEKMKEKILEIVKKFATEITDSQVDYSVMTYKTQYYFSNSSLPEIPQDADKLRYYYCVSRYGAVNIYKEKEKMEEMSQEKSKYEIEREERDKRTARFTSLGTTFFDLRTKFMTDSNRSKISIEDAVKFAIILMTLDEDWKNEDFDGFYDIGFDPDFYGCFVKSNEHIYVEDILDDAEKDPISTIERVIYSSLECGNEIPTAAWNGGYEEDSKFTMLYKFLQTIGYVLSDEEQRILDGTHEFYLKQEDAG